MNRREFLGGSLVTVAGGGMLVEPSSTGSASATGIERAKRGKDSPNIGIRAYLSREAERITDRALTEFADSAAWQRLISEKRRQYREMMGIVGGHFDTN